MDQDNGSSPQQPPKKPPDVNLVARLDAQQHDPRDESPRFFFSSAQWTADGTTVVMQSSENAVSSVVLPADLLDSSDGELQLEAEHTTRLPEPTQAVAVAPYFSLAEPLTQSYLVGCRDHPLHLYHAFPSQSNPAPLATYKLVRAETEQFLTPASLLWSSPGSHFLCGSANRLDYFDVSRPGSEGPVLTLPTIPSKRHVAKGGGVGMKGTVAALAASPVDGCHGSLLAAGTRSRWMGLYDPQRSKDSIANWSVAAAGADLDLDLTGQGIVQVVWTPCGRYLVVNERKSNHLLVYDIRGTGKLLSALCGREATTQQRLTCDTYQGQGETGSEVWAGTQNGSVVVWEDVGTRAGVMEPSWSWGAHRSPVGSTALHGCGSVVATCSGAWEHAPDGVLEDFGMGRRVLDGGVRAQGSSLKVWSMDAQADASARPCLTECEGVSGI
ncbi:hypothetical protein CDD80_3569 [Ophiocordyceps camponoti-rufipedis]|uniref:Anaphase-promoting complex subunit 4 WD40 domain-containing protein n=1 Tax=Ophiocordyceps camponoti-rufipedis TaxID=2004952 RepID=A0A2C5Z282_9HYPO|nr:hypothetical protein CDD80_3569 [Ophiocordyceps camponoti-rufipedis]